MAKPDIQQQIDGLQHHIDSLVNNNNLLKHQVDSLQQSINSTRDSLQNMLQQNPSDTVSSISGYDWEMILWLLFCIAIGCGLLWGIWCLLRNTLPSQYKEFIKRWWWILPITIALLWVIVAYWQVLLAVAALLLIAYGAYNYFGKKKEKCMLEKKNFDVNYEDDKSSFSSVKKEDMQPTKVALSPCIAAVSSDTRKVKNQDGFCETFVECCKARIVAIADGVGSSYKSEVASHYVTQKAVELIKDAVISDENHIDFEKIFDDIQAGLDAEIEEKYASELSELKPSSFGTTLIVGIDFPDRFVTAYVGNGSIWHVSGYFNKFPSVVCLPWNAVNLLNPDTTMVGGKEALYKIFYYKGKKKSHYPTVLQISKLREAPGDMFILTTDGVYSSDHAIASKDETGDIWVPSTAQYGLLYDMLKEYVEGSEEITDERLKAKIDTYLAHINEAQIMDDDTTLAIFISAEAKNHFIEGRTKTEDEAN